MNMVLLLLLFFYASLLTELPCDGRRHRFLREESNGFDRRNLCRPADDCWPSNSEFRQLEQAEDSTLQIVLPGDELWPAASSTTLNLRVSKTPGAAVYTATERDVIYVVEFAIENRLDLKIVSSGHEQIGRNIAEGCFLMIVSRMNDIASAINCRDNVDGCMTVGPGVTWSQAYEEADRVDRVIVGAQAGSVSVTGYALGGGHSPITPKLGLAVDQILEIQMVLANLSVVTMNNHEILFRNAEGEVTSVSNTDLFQAVRGGGGGTFGVVTSITFKLHEPPNKFTRLSCLFTFFGPGEAMYRDVGKAMRPLIDAQNTNFGGYTINNVICLPPGQPDCTFASTMFFDISFWGSKDNGSPHLENFKSEAEDSKFQAYSPSCSITEYDTYLQYFSASILPSGSFSFLDWGGTFMARREYADKYIEREAEILNKAYERKEFFGVAYSRIGGSRGAASSESSGPTVINPLFRNALFSVGYYTGVENSNLKAEYRSELVDKLIRRNGQYFSECDDDLSRRQWPREFWGPRRKYFNLLSVKNIYDPRNVFSCHQCIGS